MCALPWVGWLSSDCLGQVLRRGAHVSCGEGHQPQASREQLREVLSSQLQLVRCVRAAGGCNEVGTEDAAREALAKLKLLLHSHDEEGLGPLCQQQFCLEPKLSATALLGPFGKPVQE
ncbi:hypothetical protein HaLaN_29725, partial [Haematococcus lacustris]